MHVCVFVFDLLYVDGDSLIHLPLRQRRARLAQALPNLEPGFVQFATSMEFQPAALAAAAEAAAPDAATPAEAAAAVSAVAADAEAQEQPQSSPQPALDKPHTRASKRHKAHTHQAPKPLCDKDANMEAGQHRQDAALGLDQPDQNASTDTNQRVQDSSQNASMDAYQRLQHSGQEGNWKAEKALPGTTDAVACMPGEAGLHVDAAAAASEAASGTAQGDVEAVVNVSQVAVQSIEERIQVCTAKLGVKHDIYSTFRTCCCGLTQTCQLHTLGSLQHGLQACADPVRCEC